MPVTIMKRRERSSKYDWASMRASFISRNLDTAGSYSLQDLAKDHNISYGVVKNRAGKDGWMDELAKTQAQRAALAIQKGRDVNLFDEYEIRSRHAIISRGMMKLAFDRLKLLRPEQLTNREMIELLKIALPAERAAVGMPDEVNINTVGDGHMRDFSMAHAKALVGRIIDIVKEGDTSEPVAA